MIPIAAISDTQKDPKYISGKMTLGLWNALFLDDKNKKRHAPIKSLAYFFFSPHVLLPGISEIFGQSTAEKHAAFRVSRCQLERTAHAGLQIYKIPKRFEETRGDLKIVDKSEKFNIFFFIFASFKALGFMIACVSWMCRFGRIL